MGAFAFNGVGVAPFYMLAWQIGGTPQTTFMGTDNQTLGYTVAHPPGECAALA